MSVPSASPTFASRNIFENQWVSDNLAIYKIRKPAVKGGFFIAFKPISNTTLRYILTSYNCCFQLNNTMKINDLLCESYSQSQWTTAAEWVYDYIYDGTIGDFDEFISLPLIKEFAKCNSKVLYRAFGVSEVKYNNLVKGKTIRFEVDEKPFMNCSSSITAVKELLKNAHIAGMSNTYRYYVICPIPVKPSNIIFNISLFCNNKQAKKFNPGEYDVWHIGEVEGEVLIKPRVATINKKSPSILIGKL